ncbi:hypothetical protein DH2020_018955 [Rehmannia glutinosa]|uniref:Reverse transcriptase Ty1/copia-type domain-containing protein n=1 Tax=Rehmannia glutinosa TaxID=99300 RepID=A0ABR0WKF1_REHGL
MDVKTTFLNGDIDETIYMVQPENFVSGDPKSMVCKLKKSIYGLKQASRQWYHKFHQVVVSFGFETNAVDDCVYHKFSGSKCIFLVLYVDDILLATNDSGLLHDTKKYLSKKFEMKDLGEASFVLGIQIKQCQEGIYISQSKYTKELLKKFDIEEGRTVSTPMATNVKIDKDEKGKSVDESKYRGMIGSLLYLTASRPDILHAVCLCARFQSNPKEYHLSAVKRIFRYLKGTIQYGLFYPKNENFSLKGYSDSDYVGCRVDRKSTSGTCQMLGNRLVSWFSKKQNSIATSTVEAEYIAAGSCCAQVLWMRQQLRDYEIEEKEISIMCDNTSPIAITQNHVLHSRTKHIDVRYHFIRDHV